MAFEDIEDRLKNGNKPPSKKRRIPIDENDIANALEDKFGFRPRVVRGSGVADVIMDEEVHRPILNKIDGVITSLSYIATELKVKPVCLDANKAELKEGDILKCPGNEFKTVLKVGWKFALLSHTEDPKKVDSVWFEDQIISWNFIKKV